MKQGKEFSSMLLWRDELRGNYGPGVSRPREGDVTRLFTLLVRQSNARPMKVTLPARNKTEAMRYGRNRWPGAQVEVAA
jgi:hypothetical protein